jgi:hypothetical protein
MAKSKGNARETSDKLSYAVYGTGIDLERDANNIADIVKQTSLEVSSKFGKRLDNKVIDSFTQMNLSNVFSPSSKEKGKDRRPDDVTAEAFRELMSQNSGAATSMLAGDRSRIVDYSNYAAIAENIPEMALAKNTYISNILSPDDYTKGVFNIDYTSPNQADVDAVKKNLKKLIKKYRIETNVERIISDALVYGDCFVSVLPYDKEIGRYLASSYSMGTGFLNESIGTPEYERLNERFDLEFRSQSVNLSESLLLEDNMFTDEEAKTVNEAFGEHGFQRIADDLNNNIQIRTVTDMLVWKAKADNDIIFRKSMIDVGDNGKKGRKKKNKFDSMEINGAAMEILDPSRVVELKVGNVCYGYYYVQPGFAGGKETPFNAQTPKMYAQTSNPMNPTLQPQSKDMMDGNSGVGTPEAQSMNVSDDKLQIIAQVLLKALGKKLNKEYIEGNKEFKDLLYNLLKQRYILERGVSIMYFMPEEIVHFHADSIYKDIVFFAKIYLATLTNTVIVKLGRGHDKRIFYVDVGADANHEQSIAKVVQDVKTKEFRMSSIGSISSILSLNPGMFDDIYMPQINGQRPVDIDILQGMDQEVNNEFTEFLRKSMIEGTGLPQALLEANDSIEFARQISAQNVNFCRRVVRYQKLLAEPCATLIRLLYMYEYRYSLDGKTTDDDVDLNNIEVEFPAPGSLNLSNLVELLTQVDQKADYIAKRYIPEKADMSTADEIAAFKGRIIEKELPQIEWDEYKDLYESFKKDYIKDQMTDAANQAPMPEDPMGGGF